MRNLSLAIGFLSLKICFLSIAINFLSLKTVKFNDLIVNLKSLKWYFKYSNWSFNS